MAAAVIIVALATTVELGWLARMTSATTMAIFATVNTALVVIKHRDGPTSTFQVPGWVPVVGALTATSMFAVEAARVATG